ncbi:MAG: 50S ribosomal protein L29 [Clostridia bacterium]|nr:50S ribosomal protein L29 [Clostridia bacterium]
MKTQEIRELTHEELVQRMQELKKEFFNLRFQLATGQLNNPARIKLVKKDIARVKTVMRENELRSQKAAK